MILRQREEIREKLAAAKEKRLLNQKLGKVKTLGEDDPWLDDTAAWIERSRKLQREKELADKRAKLLEEMDQEFGVSTLVEEEFMRRKMERYSARDLQGLTVEHDPGAFREGETLVLTLKDKGEGGQWGRGGDNGDGEGTTGSLGTWWGHGGWRRTRTSR
ncbi:hypothetical protein AV530_017580 [Patagioenas fasciata monilis]|uniref:Uncharacterized protein n=1 Tax=Patagioenas fasciata monilis TaxID=372326 RepID=A0A1V4JTT6_PATFA|nr:hypothetical protein AV530_017580 [Patagioenas fasciata monilis]